MSNLKANIENYAMSEQLVDSLIKKGILNEADRIKIMDKFRQKYGLSKKSIFINNNSINSPKRAIICVEDNSKNYERDN